MLSTSQHLNRGTYKRLVCADLFLYSWLLKDVMSTGIRKAALCCAGKLTALWCTCVNAATVNNDENKGMYITLTFLILYVCVLYFDGDLNLSV